MKTKATFMFVVVCLASCTMNDDSSNIGTNQKPDLSAVGITGSESLSASSDLYLAFLNSDFHAKLNGYQLVSSSIIRYDFNRPDVKLLKFGTEKANTEVLAVYDNNKREFLFAYVHEQQKVGNVEVVNQYFVDGFKFLHVEIENNKVTRSERYSDPLARIGGSWSGCMELAYNSCSSDWQCAILCGLAFSSCVGATAIACALT